MIFHVHVYRNKHISTLLNVGIVLPQISCYTCTLSVSLTLVPQCLSKNVKNVERQLV